MKQLFITANIIALIVLLLFFIYQYYISVLTSNLASYANCSKNKKQIEINKLRNIAYDFYKNHHATLKIIGLSITLLSWLIVVLMFIFFYVEIRFNETKLNDINPFNYIFTILFVLIAIIASILSAYNYKKLSADFVKYQNYLLHITYKITEEYRKEKDTVKKNKLIFDKNETYPLKIYQRYFLIPSKGFTENNPYNISVNDTNQLVVSDDNNKKHKLKEINKDYKYKLSFNDSHLIFVKQSGGYYKLSTVKYNQSYDYTQNIELELFNEQDRLFREKNNSSKQYKLSENSIVDNDNIYSVDDTPHHVIKIKQMKVLKNNTSFDLIQIGKHNPTYVFVDTNTNIKYIFMKTSDNVNLRLIDILALDHKYSGNLEKKIKSHISNAHPYQDTEYIYRTDVILDKDIYT